MARGSPVGFPSSQWDRIFRGQALDLNVILTSIHRTSIDEETKGRFGDQEIRIVVSDTKRVVRTSIDWVSAWRRAADAYSFAFPHRAKEVTAYGDYIQGEFEAKVISSHHKVVSFDKAIRNFVGGGQQVLLTDDHKFSKFYSSILMSDGSRTDDPRHDANNGPRVAINPGARKGGGKIDICRRYNGAKGCNRADGECNYRHICDSCKKAGHSAQKCNVEKK
ncbi:hypothetical protein HYPSUDRAFT_141512 [Hypholoma sublateritium FD-334 SS-4]|uniref:C3H1-type domain-containing protein n=1 Tax=Hypholoma sublateritium (strain FD-334 SS-4) TaxID=945553 RepID=A0A0D2NWE4_HYPSF|nr:hypothetical protein HYPSUDRAFT_141512 [Hypholoma sublateritium FD-334 SS-4]